MSAWRIQWAELHQSWSRRGQCTARIHSKLLSFILINNWLKPADRACLPACLLSARHLFQQRQSVCFTLATSEGAKPFWAAAIRSHAVAQCPSSPHWWMHLHGMTTAAAKAAAAVDAASSEVAICLASRFAPVKPVTTRVTTNVLTQCVCVSSVRFICLFTHLQ